MTDGPTTPAPPGGSKPLVNRVKDIMITPATEWPVIGGEAATVGSLYARYIVILAAIWPVAAFLGLMLFLSGYGLFGMGTSVIITLVIVQYLLLLAYPFLLGLVIDALAPTFVSNKSSINAFKLATYSMTPVWIAGVLAILPQLGYLPYAAAFYSGYLLYLGLPILMRTPQDKAGPYAAAATVVLFVLIALGHVVQQQVMWSLIF